MIEDKIYNKWVNIIQKFEETELSQADFCRRNNITIHKFHYWKSKIENSDLAPKPRIFSPIYVP